MEYILIQYDDGTDGYQEVYLGNLQRYTDMNGVTKDNSMGSCHILDPTPVPPTWALPDPPEEVIKPTEVHVSKLEFLDAFTDSELAAIYTAAKTVVQIEIFLDKFKVAEFINISDPKLQGGVQALETFGLISAGRSSEILTSLGL